MVVPPGLTQIGRSGQPANAPVDDSDVGVRRRGQENPLEIFACGLFQAEKFVAEFLVVQEGVFRAFEHDPAILDEIRVALQGLGYASS